MLSQNPIEMGLVQLRRGLVFVAFFSAAVNILTLTGPIFMLQVYDRVLSSGSVPTLQGLFVIVIVLYGFLGIYDFLRTRLLSRAGYRLDEAVGKHAFDLWVRGAAHSNGELNRPLSDLAVVRTFLASPATLGIFDLPWLPFYLGIIFLVHPWLGILATIGAAVVVTLALFNQVLTRKYFTKAMIIDRSESFFVEQSRRNADAIIPLGMLGPLNSRWRTMHHSGLAVGQIGSERAEGFAVFSKAARLLLQSSLLALGGYLVLQQEISAGMIVATSIIAGRALAPVDQLIGQWRNVVSALEALKRLRATLEIKSGETKRIRLPNPIGKLDVKGVTKFAIDQVPDSEHPPILQQISFSLKPGEALGIIGPSASGKSTLARILVGGWKADRGEVRLDGATFDQWIPDQLGANIGYLPQTVDLMTGTIKENIARFDPQASDESVIRAAKISGVHEMILGLPNGYATELGFHSGSLSGGQIQRVGLARAVFNTPKLIVLDEPNSNLDASGEEALSRAIAHFREAGSTVIVIAHRPSAIDAVNKIMVLRNGRIADYGDKEEIIKKVACATPVHIR